MTTTFEQARKIGYDLNAPAWRDLGNPGEYMVADYGYEDAAAWLLVDGARELLEGGDYAFGVLDQPLTLVLKATGDVLQVQYLEAQDMIDAMTPVGDVPPSDDPDA
ncbi:hypothetical protein SEA_VIBAKI_7 [Arthrobacter phage Vibaki]|uniref:Uncharacterized protein n=1 Tax=Arthrobacter phage Vibaki TaxID=2593333 RepID=A0A514TYW4_9CAUD|nr:immunity protein [Arthrobacter phage Vibaki]QDK01888.1 hypothetical protein SEA_VIBAKI_7 [Arthrobacter phage Vibaki]